MSPLVTTEWMRDASHAHSPYSPVEEKLRQERYSSLHSHPHTKHNMLATIGCSKSPRGNQTRMHHARASSPEPRNAAIGSYYCTGMRASSTSRPASEADAQQRRIGRHGSCQYIAAIDSHALIGTMIDDEPPLGLSWPLKAVMRG